MNAKNKGNGGMNGAGGNPEKALEQAGSFSGNYSKGVFAMFGNKALTGLAAAVLVIVSASWAGAEMVPLKDAELEKIHGQAVVLKSNETRDLLNVTRPLYLGDFIRGNSLDGVGVWLDSRDASRQPGFARVTRNLGKNDDLWRVSMSGFRLDVNRMEHELLSGVGGDSLARVVVSDIRMTASTTIRNK
ncbi:MAG: hypothetical protein ACLFOY_05885 [Desulfatibacillaceae bacterium]